MEITTDRNDPGINKVGPDGQNESYLVLSQEERDKGLIRPFRNKYTHNICGCLTSMGNAIAETYARNPKFYNATFCSRCGKHFPLTSIDADGNVIYEFKWNDGSGVGS